MSVQSDKTTQYEIRIILGTIRRDDMEFTGVTNVHQDWRQRVITFVDEEGRPNKFQYGANDSCWVFPVLTLES